MITFYKVKFPMIAFAILLLLTLSCAPGDKIAEPTDTPKPTPVPTGPKVFIREGHENGKIIKNAVLRMESTKDKEVLPRMTSEGAYHLDTLCGPGDTLYVWAEGYYIKRQPCDGGELYSVFLEPYRFDDYSIYAWKSALECVGCHSNYNDELTDTTHNEYPEWVSDNHSKAYINPIFQSVYLGTNGEPGFLQDNYADFGNCGFCHVPAGLDAPQLEVDIMSLASRQPSAAHEGVTCDVCHKALEINLSHEGFPYRDRPGALSYQFLRPPNNAVQFYIGPKIFTNLGEFNKRVNGNEELDVGSDGSAITYSQMFEKSVFCAACHYGKYWDLEIYNSYGEWLDSAYAKAGKSELVKTCQDCHMKTGIEYDEFCKPSEDEEAEPFTTHNMMARVNGKDEFNRYKITPCLIKNAASLEVKVKRLKETDQIEVVVEVVNQKAGHKFPTDSPLRHLILIVEAQDANDTPLYLVDGPTIPLWGGVGIPENGDFAGQAGEVFANLLMEDETNTSPTAAYWKKVAPAYVDSDTRLLPPNYNDNKFDYGAVTEKSKYLFPAPNGDGSVYVRLIYRYAPIDMARSKGWIKSWGYPYILLNDQPLDIIVAEQEKSIPD